MESLAQASVANANLVYANSGVNAQLRLVYGAAINYVETRGNISSDLTAIRSTSDGALDVVHTLRTQYGADVVTLIGEGYRASGSCGIGGLMSTVSTSFASYAFSVVDRTCAVGNLSYAHEVGHNQGLNHDAGQHQQHTFLSVRVRIPESVWPLPDADGVRQRDADTVPVQSDRLVQRAADRHVERRTTPAR